MRKARGSKLVVKALLDEGVRFAFGIPGTHNIELYDALESADGIEPVLVTDERGASFMVDGLCRTAGPVGVLNVVPGAGVTHALSGIAEAFMDNVPVVVIACGIRQDTGRAYQLHAIDQLAVVSPVTKTTFRVKTATEIYPTIRRAFEVARSGCPGPVAVEIAADLLMVPQERVETSFEPGTVSEARPDPDQVAQAARMLTGAELPALYLGAGAAAAAGLAVQLAERLGAPAATTIQGKGVFPETHPLWLWNGFGAQAPRFVRTIMDRCDCLLAIGCRFSEVATGSYGIEPPTMIHVDIDPEVFQKNFKAALAIESDAAAFLDALLARLERARRWDDLAAEVAAGHQTVLDGWSKHESKKRVTPYRFFDGLQRHCRPGTIYSTDSGNGTFLAMEHLRLDEPGRFIGPVDFSCMGYSIPAAIGASFGNPERDVVALAGDGALLMTGMEVLTAVANKVAPMICVLRDGKLGQIAQFQKIPLNRETCSVLPEYSVRRLSEATGCQYFRLDRDEDLDHALPAALRAAREGSPAMVEVAIDYGRKTYFTKGVVKTNFWRFSWGNRLRVLLRAFGRRLGPD
jgi:acetolactate synthase-1/2/3 large subunit